MALDSTPKSATGSQSFINADLSTPLENSRPAEVTTHFGRACPARAIAMWVGGLITF